MIYQIPSPPSVKSLKTPATMYPPSPLLRKNQSAPNMPTKKEMRNAASFDFLFGSSTESVKLLPVELSKLYYLILWMIKYLWSNTFITFSTTIGTFLLCLLVGNLIIQGYFHHFQHILCNMPKIIQCDGMIPKLWIKMPNSTIDHNFEKFIVFYWTKQVVWNMQRKPNTIHFFIFYW